MEKKIKKEILCYVAGHSGGHIIPCLTLAQQEKQQHGIGILFFSSTKMLDQQIIQKSTIVDYHVRLPLAQKRRWYHLPGLIAQGAYAFLYSFFMLHRHRPARIISTGSIIAIPVCIAGWILRIPIELFEVNATPGKTMRLLSFCATNIYVCFEKTKAYFPNKPSEVRAYPIQFGKLKKSKKIVSNQPFQIDRFTIFIHGGSQGSQKINTIIKEVIATSRRLPAHMHIIHQTGDNPKEWQQYYASQKIPAYVFAYETDLAPYYHAANLIICRAGAGALFEAVHFKKQCITIPLAASTTSHQKDNAAAIVDAYPHLFQWIEENNNTTAQLSEILNTIVQSYTDRNKR